MKYEAGATFETEVLGRLCWVSTEVDRALRLAERANKREQPETKLIGLFSRFVETRPSNVDGATVARGLPKTP